MLSLKDIGVWGEDDRWPGEGGEKMVCGNEGGGGKGWCE